jgi:hypothetical protein
VHVWISFCDTFNAWLAAAYQIALLCLLYLSFELGDQLVAAMFFFLLFLLCASFTHSSCPIGQVQSAQGEGCIEVKKWSEVLLNWICSILFFYSSKNTTWIIVKMQRLGAFYLVAHVSLDGGAMPRSGPQISTSRSTLFLFLDAIASPSSYPCT